MFANKCLLGHRGLWSLKLSFPTTPRPYPLVTALFWELVPYLNSLGQLKRGNEDFLRLLLLKSNQPKLIFSYQWDTFLGVIIPAPLQGRDEVGMEGAVGVAQKRTYQSWTQAELSSIQDLFCTILQFTSLCIFIVLPAAFLYWIPRNMKKDIKEGRMTEKELR